MSNVLSAEQREQAGSDSYNRFEYQVHWIVCHIISQIEQQSKCVIFCEFHDDMAEFSIDNEHYQFYQIKTKEKNDDWDIIELSQRTKKKNETYKKSFLGFIFYNFFKFNDECASCHFVSNNGFDYDVRLWQSIIEDDKCIKKENNELYEKIKNRIMDEYKDDLPINFDDVFDKFIQKTYIHKSDLQLTTYENQVSGVFFKQLADKHISTETANLIFQQLINEVRKKSKEKIKTPISFSALVEKKGIVVNDINEKINNKISTSGNYSDFVEFLNTLSLPKKTIKNIQNSKTLHDARWLNIQDIKYQEIVLCIRKSISTYKLSKKSLNIDELKIECLQELKSNNLYSDSMDTFLIEVLYYEQLFR